MGAPAGRRPRPPARPPAPGRRICIWGYTSLLYMEIHIYTYTHMHYTYIEICIYIYIYIHTHVHIIYSMM